MRHPCEMGAAEVEVFLNMLANERQVSPSTHNQALSALLFLYREVLALDLPWLNGLNRPTQKRRIPSVLTRDKVAALFSVLDGDMALLAKLLYGTGMRLMESLRLRIKDVDFDRRVIVVRDGKGGKDRVVMLPQSLAPALKAQLLHARVVWDADAKTGRGGVETPHALEKKYPKVGNTWAWFWLFPSPTLSVDPRSGVERRQHLFEERLQRAVKKASALAGIAKPVVRPHAAPFLRHAPAPVRHRHSHGAGAAGSFRRVHHHDLYTCAQGGGRWHGQPAGRAGAPRLTGCLSGLGREPYHALLRHGVQCRCIHQRRRQLRQRHQHKRPFPHARVGHGQGG